MVIEEIKTIASNIEDFIDVPDGIGRLRKAVLTLAISGKLVPQDPKEGTAEELYGKILGKRKKSNKKQKPPLVISEEEIPFDIPRTWKWVRITDLYETITPPEKVKTKEMQTTGKYPVIDQGERFISGYIDDAKVVEVEDGVVIFGDHTRHVKMVDFNFVAGADGTKILKPVSVNLEWFYRVVFFSKPETRGYGRHFKILNASMVPLPPLAEQKRIVDKVDELMKIIDDLDAKKKERDTVRSSLAVSAFQSLGANDSSIALEHMSELVRNLDDVKELEKGILSLAVSGKLIPQDPKDGTAEDLYLKIQEERNKKVNKSSGKKIKPLSSIGDNEIPFEIPKTWKWVQTGDLFLVERGGSPRPIKSYLTDKTDGLNWIKIGDTDMGGKYITNTKEKIIKAGLKKTRVVHKGDLLLTNSMSFGRPYILNIDGCIHDGWLVLKPYYEKIDRELFYYFLSSPSFFSQFSNLASGAVVSNLNSEKVQGSFMPLPPLAEQKRIVEKVNELMTLTKQLKSILKNE
ncbi:MAG: restriction endonuclease subunit S [Candidatus Paceibacterota bacterium]